MAPELLKLLFVSAVVMGLSHTIAKERIFRRVRLRLGGKETFYGYLVSCPYCVSHWVAFLLVPLFGVYPLHVAVRWGVLSSILDWFFSAILVTVVAAFLRVLFWFVDEAQALVRRKKTHEEVDTQAQVLANKHLAQEEERPSVHH